jgi:hypothetical protein
MECRSVGLAGFPRWMSYVGRRAVRCAVMAFFLAVGGLIGATAPSGAAVIAPHRDAFAGAPPIMVRDYCGHGYHRVNKQRTKWGSWVGKCVPNKPKKQQPASPPQNQPG